MWNDGLHFDVLPAHFSGRLKGGGDVAIDIFGPLPSEEEKALLIFNPFDLDEGFIKTIWQAVASSTSAFAEALLQ